MKRDILDLIKRQDHVSFAELSRMIPGFKAEEGQPEHCIGYNDYNWIFWSGLSEPAVVALEELRNEQAIHFVPSQLFVYLMDGVALRLPLVKKKFKYKKPHWLPVVIRPGPDMHAKRSSVRSSSKRHNVFRTSLAQR